MQRKHNFYAGPSTLPSSVLEQMREELVDYRGEGLSMIETSHRSKMYDRVHHAVVEGTAELLGARDSHHVLLLGGGATLQFGMVPMNFLSSDSSCDFTISGSWATKAAADAGRVGAVNPVFDGSPDKFTRLPDPAAVRSSPSARYLHLTSNETIQGLQWQSFPEVKAPLVADMSSDILSRPIPIERFGVIYAGAQKNLGPAGVTIVLVRKDMLDRIPDTLPAYLDYRVHMEKDSLYNTPPVFSVWGVSLVLDWIREQGGLQAIAERNDRKAAMLYDAIESSDGFYSCPVDKNARSRMNVVFGLGSEELESRFLAEAEQADMLGLKGHRSVGGCRASLYNALGEESVGALIDFMGDFARRNG